MKKSDIASFSEYIQQLDEGFVNLLPHHEEEKRKHVDKVWDMIQASYAKVGGIKGSGFSSKEDMIKNIPMWKLGKTNGVVNAVTLYKDKSGRKSIASATDGTIAGKKRLAGMYSSEATRSYSEISGPALKFLKKVSPEGHVTKHAYPYHKAEQIVKGNGDIVRPVPHDDPEVKEHPELKNHFYQRQIGGEWHTKVMVGTVGKKIS